MNHKHPPNHHPAGARADAATQTVEDVTRKNVQAMRQLEEAALARRTTADRVASVIARFCGSMTFVVLHVIFFTAWIGYNALPAFKPFDPYPFTFLTLVVSLEAIFLSTFILISQNYDMRISERRNQLDLQINLLSEQENTLMLQMLDRIAKKVGAHVADDGQIQALEEATRPEALVEQIEESYTPPPSDKGN
ncbi:MAG: DUF1003 domain-containing protein [Burkholderiales bacterium]|nr:DUF1003 domain-containing protein [Burkholderiales bacterium]